MSIPSFKALLGAMGTTRETIERTGSITIPLQFFKFLVQLNIKEASFDSARYISSNPDVAEALAKGELESAWSHYYNHGYFEGRPGVEPTVDDKWYQDTYSDVAAAIKGQIVASSRQHFIDTGESEFRFPNSDAAIVWSAWKASLATIASSNEADQRRKSVNDLASTAPPDSTSPLTTTKKISGYKLKRR